MASLAAPFGLESGPPRDELPACVAVEPRLSHALSEPSRSHQALVQHGDSRTEPWG